MSPGGLPILTYHAIDDTGSVIATRRSWFLATLDALGEAGFRPVDLGDWIARGRPEVGRGFALTFDDGLRSILDVADALIARRVPATVFLVTDRVGSDNDWLGQPPSIPRAPLLAWSEVEALAAAGFAFAAHGRTHRRLDRCGPAALHDELWGARDAVEQRLGRSCRLLAYPYGAANDEVRQAAADVFDAAFGTRLDLATAAQDRFDLARIDACYLGSPRPLERLLAGRAALWLRGRRLLRAARAGWSALGESPPGGSQGKARAA
jgi:peptidoglycan/xylan/chitin deacetylase (PgdA/CDA1 family)